MSSMRTHTSGEIALLLEQMGGGSKSRGIHQLIEPRPTGCLEKMIPFFGGNSPHLSERFYFFALSALKPHAYKPTAETRRVFAWASSGRSERMPSQFFSN